MMLILSDLGLTFTVQEVAECLVISLPLLSAGLVSGLIISSVDSVWTHTYNLRS